MRFIKRTFGGLLFGIIFTAVGIGAMLLFGTLSTLTCARDLGDGGRCTLVTSSLRGSQTQEIALSQLTGADVERSTGSRRERSSSETYRIILLTHKGPIPFTSAYSSGYDSKKDIAERVSAFVIDPSEPNLEVSQDDRWLGYLFGGVFGGVGVLIFLGSLLGVVRLLLGGWR
jgi:hypothetical protein